MMTIKPTFSAIKLTRLEYEERNQNVSLVVAFTLSGQEAKTFKSIADLNTEPNGKDQVVIRYGKRPATNHDYIWTNGFVHLDTVNPQLMTPSIFHQNLTRQFIEALNTANETKTLEWGKLVKENHWPKALECLMSMVPLLPQPQSTT
ncbi:MAG: hypothetical protein U0003_05610 [Vampirovibrionales bacterium]